MIGNIGTAAVRLVGKDDTAQAFRSVIRNAETAQKQISTKLRAAFNFLGAGTAIYALTRAIGSAIKAGDDLAKFAQKSGLAAEAASELAHAAKMADVDLGSLETGVKKMQVSLSQAATGNKEANDSLKALGLSFRDLQALKPDEQFEKLAEQISKLKDPADRTRAAVSLFGRSGADLLPLFEQGAAGIRAAREEAEKLGKSFSQAELDKFSEVDDAWKRMKQSASGLADTLALKLAPAISRVMDAFAANLGGGSEMARLRQELNNLVMNKAAMGSPEGQARFARLRALLDSHERAGLLSSKGGRVHQFEGDAAPGFGAAPQKAKEIAPVFVTAARASEEFADSLKNTGTAAQRAQADYLEFRSALEHDLARGLLGEGQAGIDEFNKRLTGYFDEHLKAVEVTAERMVVANEKAKQFMDTLKDESVRQLFTTVSDVIANLGHGMDSFADDAIAAFRRILANAATMELFKLLSGIGSNSANGSFLKTVGGFFGSLFTGGGLTSRDSGGRGVAGEPYLIGRGAQPELFIPDRPGSFIPANKLPIAAGGGSPITIINHNDIRIDSRSDRAAIQADILAAIEVATHRSMEALIENRGRGRRL